MKCPNCRTLLDMAGVPTGSRVQCPDCGHDWTLGGDAKTPILLPGRISRKEIFRITGTVMWAVFCYGAAVAIVVGLVMMVFGAGCASTARAQDEMVIVVRRPPSNVNRWGGLIGSDGVWRPPEVRWSELPAPARAVVWDGIACGTNRIARAQFEQRVHEREGVVVAMGRVVHVTCPDCHGAKVKNEAGRQETPRLLPCNGCQGTGSRTYAGTIRFLW